MQSGSMLAAYVTGEAAAFLGDRCFDAEARARAVRRASRPVGPAVLSCLRAQNARFGQSAARQAHLDALESGAAAVVTGQQVGLFLGPLYTLYKAASAIAVSRVLARQTGMKVVPVFWLQTEDHDFEEIASVAVPRDGVEPCVLELPASDARDARVSLAHRELPAEIETLTAALRAELERFPHAAEHLERIERAYQPGVRVGDAFARVLAELFAEHGLLVLDPRDPALAAEAAGVHERALREAEPIAAALLARCAELSAAGYPTQVHVRQGAPLSFFHPEGAACSRHRLVPCRGGFACAGAAGEASASAERTLQSLLTALERDPLCFSTSALLRPIVQDTLLPTAAYVGGPGELLYFAQLGPLYAAFGLSLPLFVLRARFRIVEDKTARALARLGIGVKDVARGAASLLAERAARSEATSPEQLERLLVAGFDQTIDSALAELGQVPRELSAAIDKTRATVRMAASKLAHKYADGLGRADTEAVRDLERVQLALHPRGEPQERVYGVSYYAARYGERVLIERILQQLEADPFEPEVRDLLP